ncbi:MAG: histidinol dehydrogenase [Alphaproteobacteria bacterium]|nr:histidinol dehydrogenase [Alphaproteobacteria bacterium]
MPARLDCAKPGFERAFARLLAAKRESAADVNDAVARIVADVRKGGDKALIRYTRRFDRFPLTTRTLRVAPRDVAAAVKACDRRAVKALELAHRRIADFHARQKPADLRLEDKAGLELGLRWTPLAAAGLYVPGGTAAYPSSVLMNAVPAKTAGVERLVMVVPAPKGRINPLVLAAARIAGVDEIYRVGGAQAVAALAYGTETIRPVDKIVGPGNAYVAAAKRQVFGQVGIDMIAGPSEILVVADGANDPAWIAADLLSQAEHDVSAQSILIAEDAAFIRAVERAVARHLKTLPRAAIAGESWRRFGATIRVRRLADAVPLIDRLAPEHLELAVANPRALAHKIRNAGAIFMGRFAPEALGDYIAGPNHVLPTARSARFSSGLGVLDFMKRTSLIGGNAAALDRLGPATVALARAEGLDAHALSVLMRLGRGRED